MIDFELAFREQQTAKTPTCFKPSLAGTGFKATKADPRELLENTCAEESCTNHVLYDDGALDQLLMRAFLSAEGSEALRERLREEHKDLTQGQLLLLPAQVS